MKKLTDIIVTKITFVKKALSTWRPTYITTSEIKAIPNDKQNKFSKFPFLCSLLNFLHRCEHQWIKWTYEFTISMVSICNKRIWGIEDSLTKTTTLWNNYKLCVFQNQTKNTNVTIQIPIQTFPFSFSTPIHTGY